jgi:16S rRNA (uracil1498-N3)-methyltransferase
MKRAFVERNIWQAGEGDLSAEESHHLLGVMRARQGEEIEIFDGRGMTARAELVSCREKKARVKIHPGNIRHVAPPVPALTLIQAIPKHSGMEAIIQKATELGVMKIVPVMTGRVVVKLDDAAAAARVERWRKIALASVKQCQAAWLPEVDRVVPLAEAAARDRSDLKIFGSLDPRAPGFREVMGKVDRSSVKSATIVIGPEGDLSGEEQRLLAAAGFQPVSFGEEVLRVETAAIFGLSVLKYELR